MLMAIVFFVYLIVHVVANLILVLLRNLRGQQFFRTKTAKLPVLPDANIFSGHLFSVISNEMNWEVITQLHEKYGPTFGYYHVDRPWVSTKDLDLIKLIELDQPTKHMDRANLGLPFSDFNHSIFQVNGDRWRRVRRAITPALTNLKVRANGVTSDIQSIIEQLEAGIEHRMRKSAQRKVANNIGINDTNNNNNECEASDCGIEEQSMVLHADDMFQRYTLAVIFLITYKRENTIDFKAERDEWVEAMDESARQITNPLVMMSVMFPFLRPVVEFLIQVHPVGRLKARIIDYIVEATDLNRTAREQHAKVQRKLSLATGCDERPFSELKKAGAFKRRLIDTIIDALMDKRIQYDDFIGSALFLLLAGFMTTADTITCLVWQLARHPDIQEKLRKSIQSEGIDSEYLHWCVQETIRFHPAVPLGIGRILGEDVTVNGLFLPKGCFVMPSTHSIHHDKTIWPEPERFWPERWKHSADFHPAAFMGFGLGPRNCVGGKLAMHEIKLVTEMLMRSYRIEKCAETPERYRFSAPGLLYTNMDHPIKVRLVRLVNGANNNK